MLRVLGGGIVMRRLGAWFHILYLPLLSSGLKGNTPLPRKVGIDARQ